MNLFCLVYCVSLQNYVTLDGDFKLQASGGLFLVVENARRFFVGDGGVFARGSHLSLMDF